MLLELGTIASLAMVYLASAAAVGHRLASRDALNVSMTAFTLTQSVPGGGAVAAAETVPSAHAPRPGGRSPRRVSH